MIRQVMMLQDQMKECEAVLCLLGSSSDNPDQSISRSAAADPFAPTVCPAIA